MTLHLSWSSRSAMQSLQKLVTTSRCVSLFPARSFATWLAAVFTLEVDLSLVGSLKPRFEPRYWLIAACVVPSLLAASTCENLCLSMSSLATRDLNTGRNCWTISSHGGRIFFTLDYNVVILGYLKLCSSLDRGWRWDVRLSRCTLDCTWRFRLSLAKGVGPPPPRGGVRL